MTKTATQIETRSRQTATGAGKAHAMVAHDLVKAFGGQTVLDGVSFELNEGEVVLLRGANGSGKTTLLNILTGHLEPDAGEIEIHTDGTTERFSFPRPWWQQLNPFDAFLPEHIAQEGVGRTWQDIRLFSTQSLLDNVAVATPDQSGESPLRALVQPFRTRSDEAANQNAVSEQIGAIGLEGRQSSSADKVSLGQSKRIAILRAVRAGAEVLFLDEPLSGLDDPGIEDVMQLLRRLAEEEDVTLVIVEHVFNIPRVLELASTVWTLENGRLAVESPEEVSTGSQSGKPPLRKQIRQSFEGTVAGEPPLSSDESQVESLPEREVNRESIEIDETVIARSTPRIHEPISSASQLQSMVGGEEVGEQRLPGGAVLTKYAPEERERGASVLEIDDLVVYRGSRLVIGNQRDDGSIEGLSMTLREGEWAVLQAPNGWGKTTLLEAIAGTLPIDRGTIHLRGEPIGDRPAWNRDVSLLQSREHAFPTLTAREVLDLTGVDDPPDDLVPLLDRRVGSLSGGETQKVALASALSRDVSVRLMDEPFSALDTSSIRRISNSLTDSRRADCNLVALPTIDL